MWAHFAEHPEEGGLFNAAMVAKAYGAVAAIVAAYDFSSFGLIGNIGGGRGHLLQAVLDRAPSAKGVLFDQPHVINEVAGLASERLTLHAGDFFNDKLPACDTYLIMEVIHDWNDADSASILKAIWRAAPPRAKRSVSRLFIARLTSALTSGRVPVLTIAVWCSAVFDSLAI